MFPAVFGFEIYAHQVLFVTFLMTSANLNRLIDCGVPRRGLQEPAHLQTFAMEAESDDFDSPLSTRGHNKSLDVESLPRSEKGNARLQQASQRKTRSGTSDSSTSAFMGGGLNGNPPQSGTSTE